MHALFFAGLLLSVAVIEVLSAGFFIHAWLYRRRDTESLLFGSSTLFFAIYTGSGGLLFEGLAGTTDFDLRPWVSVCVASSVLAVALLIHFALRYGRIRSERTIMAVIYSAAVGFLALVVTDQWWIQLTVDDSGLDLLGLRVPVLVLGVTGPALAYHLAAPVGIGAVSVILARSWLRGRQEIGAAVLGAVALTVTAANDALALGAGWLNTIPLLPLGCVALVYGVRHSLLSHYGGLSSDLQRQTDELHQRSQELAESMKERERRQEELVERERLATVGELTGVIAAEVRTPLKIVDDAVVELQRPETAAANVAPLLDTIKSEIADLEELVARLLDYARPVILQKAPLDLRLLLQRALATAEGGATVQSRIEWQLVGSELAGDGELLGRALSNVISHGIQAMADDSRLVVRVDGAESQGVACAAIAIIVTGDGTTEQEWDQAMSAVCTPRTGLAGLALPIAARIIEAHGGTMRMSSVAGAGTTVTVVLPRAAGAELPQSSG